MSLPVYLERHIRLTFLLFHFSTLAFKLLLFIFIFATMLHIFEIFIKHKPWTEPNRKMFRANILQKGLFIYDYMCSFLYTVCMSIYVFFFMLFFRWKVLCWNFKKRNEKHPFRFKLTEICSQGIVGNLINCINWKFSRFQSKLGLIFG